MANSLDSNITRPLARAFLKGVESSRVVTKSVDTQMLPDVTPRTGDKVDVKRPHRYNSLETSDGDISLLVKNDIISGKATGTVQDMITVAVDFSILEQATELDQMEEILRPMARRCVTTLEKNLATFMIENAALSYGQVGVAVNEWGDVAGPGALMDSLGVPTDMERFYLMNPFTTKTLADTQSGLASGENRLVTTAWEKAQITSRFGGLSTITNNALSTYTTGATTDRDGALLATPNATYLTAKDTMTQVLSLTGLSASLADAVRPGDVIEFTGVDALARSRLNQDTRTVAFDETGAPIKWRCTVLVGGNTNVSGEVTVTVTGPALNEAAGQYNNISSPLVSADAFTILGVADTVVQPNLFYHKQAFSLATVKLPKLFSTDTLAVTNDGFSIRVSKFSDGNKNQQTVRFDLLPVFASLDPFKAGTGWRT